MLKERAKLWRVGIVIVLLIVVSFLYWGLKHMTFQAQPQREFVVDLTEPQVWQPPKVLASPPPVKVTTHKVDTGFDQELAPLHEVESSADFEATGSTDSSAKEAIEPFNPVEENRTLAVEAEPTFLADPGEFVELFMMVVHDADIDTMQAMARGQAYDKLEELRHDPSPQTDRFSEIQATNGRFTGTDEYRFNVILPWQDDTPELVLRREAGIWYLDEISD